MALFDREIWHELPVLFVSRIVAANEHEPFKGLWNLLGDILVDQIVDKGEKDELLEWCANTINDRGFLKEFNQIVRTLHGVIGGIIADEKITADELEGLKDWLTDYEQFQDW